MKKHLKKIILLVLLLIILIVGYQLYQYIRIKTAKIEVTLNDNLTLEYAEKIKVSDMIKSVNGKISNDFEINTSKLGKQDITFDFTNDDGIPVSYTFQIEVKDTTEPLIWLGSTYRTTVGSNINLTDKILCGDNEDDNPTCEVVGTYDMNTPGNYELVFKATDQSGNVEEQPFTLIVEEIKEEEDSEPEEEPEIIYTEFQDVVNKHKTSNNPTT